MYYENELDNYQTSSRTSNIESNNCQNGGLEDYNNISDGIFPHFTTPSIKISLGGFHLHLLVFPFVHQFNFRIGVLVHSSFANV
jgi:hypothetical protein